MGRIEGNCSKTTFRSSTHDRPLWHGNGRPFFEQYQRNRESCICRFYKKYWNWRNFSSSSRYWIAIIRNRLVGISQLNLRVLTRIPTVKLKIPGKHFWNPNLECNRSSGFGFQKCFSRNFQFHRRDPTENGHPCLETKWVTRMWDPLYNILAKS